LCVFALRISNTPATPLPSLLARTISAQCFIG
jgi:hypothetical protein